MSRYTPLEPEVLDAIAAAGFDVYQNASDRVGSRTWLYFTDGVRIGYLQRGDFGGFSLTTVHVPNRSCGTGFQAGEIDSVSGITREALESAFYAPRWASARDLAELKKWPDMESFLKAERILKLELVRKGV